MLFGDRVLWVGDGAQGALHVVAAPVAGGEAVPFGAVPLGRGEGGELAAGPGLVAVLVRDFRSLTAPGRLHSAGADGAFRPIAADVGQPPILPWIPGTQVTAAGVLTLEDGGTLLRDGAAPAREVALPPGADLERVAAAGDLGVAATAEGALVVFDLRTDIERTHISLGAFDTNTITGLAISPEGDVAATVPSGDGDDVLLWARAGARRVRVLSRGRRYTRVATAGGRVAHAGGDGLREGERVTIIDAATRRTLFRGPPAAEVHSLAFDGRNIAFLTPACALAGPARSRRTIPPGPCNRTEIAVSTSLRAVRDGRYRVRVACINAPARRCRVSARLRTRSGRFAGRLSGRVRVGGARVLAVPLNARGRRAGDRLRLSVTVTDPGGSSRVAYDL